MNICKYAFSATPSTLCNPARPIASVIQVHFLIIKINLLNKNKYHNSVTHFDPINFDGINYFSPCHAGCRYFENYQVCALNIQSIQVQSLMQHSHIRILLIC